MNQSAETAGPPDDHSRALSGIRVLELGEMVSAPYATKLLADLGADVIKVEPPGGDRARARGPFGPSTAGRSADDAGGLHLALNTNKASVVINGDDAGRRALVALATEADIIVTNLATARLADLGFDAVRLLADRPEVVICSITPFGLTGPYADYRAEEITVAHGGGWAYQCPGATDEGHLPPLKVFGHQTDFHAGMAGAMVALAAFDRSEQTGVGDHIDLSTMAHTAGMLEAAVIAASYMGANPSRLGSRLLNPWKILPCAPDGPGRPDGLIFLVTVEQDQWERLLELMGNPEWAETGLFDTTELRLENEDLLIVYLEEWTRQHTVAELWHRGQEARICFAPVLTMADMEHQEHLVERGFLVEVEHPVAGTVTHLGPPFRSTPSLWGPLRPAPLLDDRSTPDFGPRRPHPVNNSEHREHAEHRQHGEHGEHGQHGEHGEHGDRPQTRRPLEGIRVLDFSWVWAGPYCTMHLAFLGAEVIKVETMERPDLGRRLALHPPDVAPTLNTSSYFNQWGQGKLSCRLDLTDPEGITLVERLVERSDVVVENFATGVMENLGLGYERLRAVKPDLIMASISGYGSTGPLRRYMGYGPTTGPLSGLTSLTGYEGGPPRELGISIGDPGAGITTAFAICAAIVARRASGQGCYIDTALWESTASNAVEGWMSHAMAGRQPDRMGNRDPVMAPHGCYRTGDRTDIEPDEPDPGLWISIACATDGEWRSLAELIDPALAADGRFVTAADRKRNEDELDTIVQDWVDGQDRWELTKRLQGAGVAAFPSMSPRDLLADEHLEARGFFERLPHPEVGVRTHTGVPWRSTTGDNGVLRPAPLLGQHTDQVLDRLSHDTR